MSDENKKTLQEIKNKTKPSYPNAPEFDENGDMHRLRGWLLSPDVMRGWWGEGKFPKWCKEDMECSKEEFGGWQYHGSQMFFLPTNDEILTYYRQHRLKGEGV